MGSTILVHIERLATIGQLSAMLAHEIRNPLAGIGSAVSILADELPIRDEHREVVDELQRQVQRISRTLTDLLNRARATEYDPRELRPSYVVERAAIVVRPGMERCGITLNCLVDVETPLIFADEERLMQVLLNLLLNAEQALEHGGTVTIGAGRSPDREGYVLFFIADDGPGMSEDVARSAFEPFFTTKEAGTGLGLAIARDFIEAMDGDLAIESELGKGTKLSLTLPQYTPRANAAGGADTEFDSEA